MNDKTKRYQELIKQRDSIEEEIANLDVSETKIFKFTGYYVDTGGEFSSLEDFLEEKLYNNDISYFGEKETTCVWYDEIDINMRDATQTDYERYFK